MKKQSAKKLPATRALLSHHSHTGTVLGQEHTSYPLVALLLLLVGVLLCGTTMLAYADLPPAIPGGDSRRSSPTQPALIRTPDDHTTAATAPTTISGACEAAALIKLYRNDHFSGAVLCAADGSFNLPTDLSEGANQLVARSFGMTQQEGPASVPVHITYTPATRVTGHVAPVAIKAESMYQDYQPGETVSWRLALAGGKPPYTVTIDWGDGKHDTLRRNQPGSLGAVHVYDKAGGFQDGYPVKISATDARQGTSFVQLVAIVKDQHVLGSMFARTPDPDRLQSLTISWPTYAVAVLMALSFWLGERRAWAVALVRKPAVQRAKRAVPARRRTSKAAAR